MAAEFDLRIVTPERTIEERVRSVQFRGIDGEYGILARHAPLVAATQPGLLTIERPDGTKQDLVVTEGFAEVREGVLKLVCEAGETAAEIDIERARAAEARARDLLANRAALAEEDVLRAEAALRRALTRQLAAQRNL